MIEINGVPWDAHSEIGMPGDPIECCYKYNYYELAKKLASGEDELSWYRALCQDDLWFLIFFVMRVSVANHPFWVSACQEVESGPRSHTLDLWAREHGKSTIITIASTLQRILNNPEERIAIFSHNQTAALSFLRQIRELVERSELLRLCFPDVLWEEPKKQSPKWSEEHGLIFRREGFYKESTLEAWGLLEGMPTGKHFTGRVYDDILTEDLINSPELIQKLKDMFDLSQNLGTLDGWHRVVGTTYHHEDVLMYIRAKRDDKGEPIYTTRIKAATHDGTPNGRSVWLPEARLTELRTNRRLFFAQQLLDPTPQGEQALNADYIIDVRSENVPRNLYKFMTIDPAGERQDRTGDSWAILVHGVEPCFDDANGSKVYLLDALIEELSTVDALQEIVRMYLRNGRIVKVGVEKVSMMTMEVHIANALRSHGIHLSIEAGNLEILRPSGRKKAERIESNLSWPLNNGKVHFSDAVPISQRERLKVEMRKFPYWRDDGIDSYSYLWDMLRNYRFGPRVLDKDEQLDDFWSRFERKREGLIKPPGWIVV